MNFSAFSLIFLTSFLLQDVAYGEDVAYGIRGLKKMSGDKKKGGGGGDKKKGGGWGDKKKGGGGGDKKKGGGGGD